MANESTRDIDQYEATYLADSGFESVMVNYRRRMLLEKLQNIQPHVVVEIGCGSDPIYAHYLEHSAAVDCWLVVEPSRAFFDTAASMNLPGCRMIQGFFEASHEAIARQLNSAPDLVICSGLLHEVSNARLLLESIVRIMTPKTLLHVNVPSANSFHRRVALAAGLIPDLKAMSSRNSDLQQNRVYDLGTLSADLVEAGLAIEESGGYFFKPFTHTQMEALAPELNQRVFDGLYEMGKQFPELASEIYVESRLA